MLEHLRTRDRTFFINVSDNNYRYVVILSCTHNQVCALSYLGYTTRGGAELGNHHRLDRIYHNQIGLYTFNLFAYNLNIGFGNNTKI